MTLSVFLCSCGLAAAASAAQVQNFEPTYALPRDARGETRADARTPARSVETSGFRYRDARGKWVTAPVLTHPLGKIDRRLNATLVSAASIAQDRAHAHSKSRCWRYVKTALMASGAITSYPKTAYAKQAGEELVRVYGFKKLPIADPYAAPIGAVLVYGGGRAAGHVEIRTKTGFVSDFQSPTPSKRRLIGVYAKA